MEYTKWPVYSFAQGCESIEVKDSKLSYTQDSTEAYIILDLEIKGYRNLENGFKIDLDIIDTNSKGNVSYNSSDGEFFISRGLSKNLSLRIPLEYKDDKSLEEFYHLLYQRDYVILLYSDESSSEYLRNDEY